MNRNSLLNSQDNRRITQYDASHSKYVSTIVFCTIELHGRNETHKIIGVLQMINDYRAICRG